MKTVSCVECGCTFEMYPSQTKKFCGPACWHSYARRTPATYVPAILAVGMCRECSRDFSYRRQGSRARVFCGNACMFAYRAKNPSPKRVERVTVQCKMCAKKFKKLQCQIRSGCATCCSARCRARYSLSLQLTGRVSRAETLFLDGCEASGIALTRQVKVGWYTVDAVTADGFAIEFDGEYWHSRPGMAAKDALKDKFLRSRGYAVLRVAERLARENPEAALAIVQGRACESIAA